MIFTDVIVNRITCKIQKQLLFEFNRSNYQMFSNAKDQYSIGKEMIDVLMGRL